MKQKFNFNRVALNTHKGTIIHVRIKFSNGTIKDIEPLKDNIGGIAFNTKGIRTDFDLNIKQSNQILFLNEQGEVISKVLKKKISEIEPFVIYPDGSIWSGIVGDDYDNLQLMLWSDNLIHTSTKDHIINNYYNEKVWWKTPSSMLVYNDATVQIPCRRIEHTCGKGCE
ncbi:MAG: hypothetical protein V4643_12840 [Bacteroidota bacterium]